MKGTGRGEEDVSQVSNRVAIQTIIKGSSKSAVFSVNRMTVIDRS